MSETQKQRIEGYLDRLFGYAFSLTSDREFSRDLVQDCALKALTARQIPVDEAAYRAWLFRILRNTFLDGVRRLNGGTVVLADENLRHGNEPWICDDHIVNTLTVRLGMAKLSPAHREIIVVIDIVGFSYGEAATLLGVPSGTIMSRVSRARQALLQVIEENNVRSLPVAPKQVAK